MQNDWIKYAIALPISFFTGYGVTAFIYNKLIKSQKKICNTGTDMNVTEDNNSYGEYGFVRSDYTKSSFEDFTFSHDMKLINYGDHRVVQLANNVRFAISSIWRIEVGYHKGSLDYKGTPKFFVLRAMICTKYDTYYIQGEYDLHKFLSEIYEETKIMGRPCQLWERIYNHLRDHEKLLECERYKEHDSDCCIKQVHFRRKRLTDINVVFRLSIFTSEDHNFW